MFGEIQRRPIGALLPLTEDLLLMVDPIDYLPKRPNDDMVLPEGRRLYVQVHRSQTFFIPDALEIGDISSSNLSWFAVKRDESLLDINAGDFIRGNEKVLGMEGFIEFSPENFLKDLAEKIIHDSVMVIVERYCPCSSATFLILTLEALASFWTNVKRKDEDKNHRGTNEHEHEVKYSIRVGKRRSLIDLPLNGAVMLREDALLNIRMRRVKSREEVFSGEMLIARQGLDEYWGCIGAVPLFPPEYSAQWMIGEDILPLLGMSSDLKIEDPSPYPNGGFKLQA